MQIQIRSNNVELPATALQRIEQKLRLCLARFQGSVRGAMISLQDLNGPKGGLDKECRLEIRTQWRACIRVRERDSDVLAAVTRAAERGSRAVARQADLRYGSTRQQRPSMKF